MLRATHVALLALCAQLASAVSPLSIKGPDFVNSVTGERFQIVGVAYQPGGSSGYNPESGVDPLSNGDVCLRDAALMQRLGVNAIRVYNLDPNLNHDACASIFNLAGIYMLLDVNSPFPNESLNRGTPWESYNHDYLNRTFAVVEAFKDYPNTMLFFAGNEVIDTIETAITVPYIRAVTRDIKQYIKNHSKRYIPVGYSAADVRSVLVDTWAYLQCSLTGDATDDSISDLFALNSYSWCGPATFEEAGYNTLVEYFNKTSIPVFMSEYGCREIRPRVFNEVGGLYGNRMTPYFSGGVVYEYAQEENDYGLVVLNTDGSAELRSDYDNFQKQLNGLNFTQLQSTTSLVPEVPFPKCSKSLITNPKFPSNFTAIPSPPNDGLPELIKNGIKNPHNGKIIDITDLKVKQSIKATDGTAITGLEVKRLGDDKSNVPTGVTAPSASGTTPTTTSSAAATSSSGAASGVTAVGGFGFVMSAILSALALI